MTPARLMPLMIFVALLGGCTLFGRDDPGPRAHWLAPAGVGPDRASEIRRECYAKATRHVERIYTYRDDYVEPGSNMSRSGGYGDLSRSMDRYQMERERDDLFAGCMRRAGFVTEAERRRAKGAE